jgi:hypothetical protein
MIPELALAANELSLADHCCAIFFFRNSTLLASCSMPSTPSSMLVEAFADLAVADAFGVALGTAFLFAEVFDGALMKAFGKAASFGIA